MKPRIIIAFLVLAVSAAILAGCGASKADRAEESGAAPAYNQDAAMPESKQADQSRSSADSAVPSGSSGSASTFAASTAFTASTALTGTGQAAQTVSNQILNERKIIRNANVSIEVDDFDKAYGKLEFLIAGIGYVQETKITKDKYNLSDNKEVLKTRGTIVIRVDAEKFNSVLKDVKGLGLVREENIKSDDVTDQYFDLESRLRLLKYEESRLEEYLKKLTDPDTIFKTEDKLTDIRHEIESLTGNLNKLSNLVQLSTITVNMSETMPDALKSGQSYGQKLISGFMGSLKEVVAFCGELVIALVTAIPVILLLIVIAAAALIIYRKFSATRAKRNSPIDKDIQG